EKDRRKRGRTGAPESRRRLMAAVLCAGDVVLRYAARILRVLRLGAGVDRAGLAARVERRAGRGGRLAGSGRLLLAGLVGLTGAPGAIGEGRAGAGHDDRGRHRDAKNELADHCFLLSPKSLSP